MTNPASTSRDLVLAMMSQQNFDYIAPFVLSLRNSGFQGSLVLFVSQVNEESLEKLRDNKVTIIPFRFIGKGDRQRHRRLWPAWRWFFLTAAPWSAKIWLAHVVFHLRYRRYLLYSEFLQQHAADFDRILLADCKDVFFQTDPFAWNWSPGVHFFLEDPAQRIGDCSWHRQVLNCQFGPSFVEQHAQRIPVCSGTTFGDIAGIRQYLDMMIATTMRALDLAKISCGDQGIHIYILIQNLIKNITVHENRRGPVMTMGVMHESDFQTDANGAVLNEDGSIAPVLHQYDRCPALKACLLNSLRIANYPAASLV